MRNKEKDKITRAIHMVKYRWSHNYNSAQMHSGQRARSRKRGWKPPQYTLEELRLWLRSQPRYEALRIKYMITKDKMDAPSCDRIDNSKGYSLDNMQLTTWRENKSRQWKDSRKVVLQYTMDGEFVAKYKSCIEVMELTGFHKSNIASVCNPNKREKSHKGFVWKYEE